MDGHGQIALDRQNDKWIIILEIQKQNNDIKYIVLDLNWCIDMYMYLNVSDNNI